LFVLLVYCTQVEARSADDNAALHYWQAFLLMPAGETLSEKEREALDHWATIRLDGTAHAIVGKYHSCLRSIHRAAASSRCHWGLDMSLNEDGPGADLPHVIRSWELSKAGCLRARLYYSEGKDAQALEDVWALMMMARRLGETGILMTKMAEYAVESQAIELVAAHLGDRERAKALMNRLEKLPGSASISAVISHGEKELHIGCLRSRGMKAVEPFIEDFHGADKQESASIRRFLGMEDKHIPKLCEAVRVAFDEAARIASLPLEQCASDEESFKRRLKDEFETSDVRILNLFPRLILPPIHKVRLAEARVEAQRSMLRAAVSFIVYGESRFKTIHDPFGKGPFAFQGLKDGFELKSTLRDGEGCPVTLRIGAGSGIK